MVRSKEKVSAKFVNCNNLELEQLHNFSYLGFKLSKKKTLKGSVRAKVNPAWLKWRELTSGIYDKHMSRKLNVKMHEIVIQFLPLYGAELETLRKMEEKI